MRDLNLLDTSPSDSFDRLTRLASKLLNAPVSTISLTDRDRQWFKSKAGVDITEIPREQAPCNYAIRDNGIFVVPDLQADPRFIDSALAQAGIRFYAGAPLFTRQGYGLGTRWCVPLSRWRISSATVSLPKGSRRKRPMISSAPGGAQKAKATSWQGR